MAAGHPIECASNKHFAMLKFKKTGLGPGRRPSKLTRLPQAAVTVVHTMVHGLQEDRKPLTLVDACKALGFEVTRILQLARNDLFTKEMMDQLNTRRMLEYPRNLGVALEIRDSIGDGTSRADDVRLKAIMTIEGTYKIGGGPAVQINNIQQNNSKEQHLKPGYIIDNGPPKQIEHQK